MERRSDSYRSGSDMVKMLRRVAFLLFTTLVFASCYSDIAPILSSAEQSTSQTSPGYFPPQKDPSPSVTPEEPPVETPKPPKEGEDGAPFSKSTEVDVVAAPSPVLIDKLKGAPLDEDHMRFSLPSKETVHISSTDLTIEFSDGRSANVTGTATVKEGFVLSEIVDDIVFKDINLDLGNGITLKSMRLSLGKSENGLVVEKISGEEVRTRLWVKKDSIFFRGLDKLLKYSYEKWDRDAFKYNVNYLFHDNSFVDASLSIYFLDNGSFFISGGNNSWDLNNKRPRNGESDGWVEVDFAGEELYSRFREGYKTSGTISYVYASDQVHEAQTERNITYYMFGGYNVINAIAL